MGWEWDGVGFIERPSGIAQNTVACPLVCLSCDRRAACTKMAPPCTQLEVRYHFGEGIRGAADKYIRSFLPARPSSSRMATADERARRKYDVQESGRLSRRKSLSVAPLHRLSMSHPHES